MKTFTHGQFPLSAVDFSTALDYRRLRSDNSIFALVFAFCRLLTANLLYPFQ
jgi:hypothetical protein